MIKTWEYKSLQQSLVQFCLLACLFVSLFKDWSKQMPLIPREVSYFLRLRKFDRACSFAWLVAMRIYWNKNSVCIRNEFNSHRTGLGHQHGCRFNALKYQCLPWRLLSSLFRDCKTNGCISSWIEKRWKLQKAAFWPLRELQSAVLLRFLPLAFTIFYVFWNGTVKTRPLLSVLITVN